jgi:SAM-dependent methyltransferase
MTEILEGYVLPDGTRLLDMPHPEDFYPSDRLSPAAWDVFWSARLHDWYSEDGRIGVPQQRICRWHPHLTTILDRFRTAGVRSVLCAGNGADQEPRVYAAAGMDATALDFSPVGIRLARAYPFTRKSLEQFDIGDRNPAVLHGYARPGGSVSFAVGDFRSNSVLPGPFDAVVTHCTLQTLLDAQWAALDALLARLAPGGLFVASFHNDYRLAEPYAKLLAERGFSVWSTRSGGAPDRWTAALFFSSG